MSGAQPVECGPFTPRLTPILFHHREQLLLGFNQRLEIDDHLFKFCKKLQVGA